MKKVVILLFLFFIPTSSVMAQDIFEENQYRKPITETLDLHVDGSISPYLVNLTKTYDYISRVIWELDFTDNTLDFGEFAGSTALTNGTVLLYDGIGLNDPIKSIEDFAHHSYDLRVDTDDLSPEGRYVSCRFSFWKVVPPYGLKMKDGHTFQVEINDNISAIDCDFELHIQGFKDINIEPEISQDWLQDMFIFDNPVKLVVAPFLLPLALIFTWEPTLFLVGLGLAFIELLILRGIYVRLKYKY